MGDQSKHAEKLLEINSSIMNRDKTLQIELQLSQSMQEEMASKLASYQRVVKGLNQKISGLETERMSQLQETVSRLDRQEEEKNRLQDNCDRLKELHERSELEVVRCSDR